MTVSLSSAARRHEPPVHIQQLAERPIFKDEEWDSSHAVAVSPDAPVEIVTTACHLADDRVLSGPLAIRGTSWCWLAS